MGAIQEPADARASAEPKKFSRYVYVAQGDTLVLIASRHNVRVEDLMKANGLASQHVEAGQYLGIPVTPRDPAAARS